MASAGGPRRGRLPDRSGGQRPAGRPDRGRHEGLAQDSEEDGREVGHLDSESGSAQTCLSLMKFERSDEHQRDFVSHLRIFTFFKNFFLRASVRFVGV